MRQPRLIDRVRAVDGVCHLSLRTEQAYSNWSKRFILFHGKRHPEEMGVDEIRRFLSHPASFGLERFFSHLPSLIPYFYPS